MPFPSEINTEIVGLVRSIRGYLTETGVHNVPRKSWLKQTFLGDEHVNYLIHGQAEINTAFADLDVLLSVIVPFWLSDEEKTESQVKDQAAKFAQTYPQQLATSTITTIEQSLDEIEATLSLLEEHGSDALYHWFDRNHRIFSSIDELTEDLVIISPLTTDYLVAALYLNQLRHERKNVAHLYPTGWMPNVPEPTLSTIARNKILEPETREIVVMVDRNVTGFTREVIADSLRKMFEGKMVIG